MSISYKIKQAKLIWAGHVARRNDNSGQSDWRNGNQEKGNGGEVDKKKMGEISQRQKDLEGSLGGL